MTKKSVQPPKATVEVLGRAIYGYAAHLRKLTDLRAADSREGQRLIQLIRNCLCELESAQS